LAFSSRSTQLSINPYQAPRANLDEQANGKPAPALWNPGAAANWCLLFSPVFGAWLHMKNWQVLEQPGKARAAQVWLVLAVLLMLTLIFGSRLIPTLVLPHKLMLFIFLLAWYFGSAKAQMAYVEQHFGQRYQHRGWSKPVGLALLVVVGLFFCLVALNRDAA
jgi:hypothetical protein